MLGAPVEIVPKHMGTTCFSLAFTLASALFGTFTPLASNWLINGPMTRLTRFWLMFAAVLGIIAALTVLSGSLKPSRVAKPSLPERPNSVLGVQATPHWPAVRIADRAEHRASVTSCAPCSVPLPAFVAGKGREYGRTTSLTKGAPRQRGLCPI